MSYAHARRASNDKMADRKDTFTAFVLVLGLFHQAESLPDHLSLEQIQYFSSKTRYVPVDEPFAGMPDREQCEPRYVDVTVRHGTRFPSKGDVGKIEKMITRVNNLFSSASPFRSGELTLPVDENPFTEALDKLLSTVGEEEMYNLSRRLRDKFRSLLDVSYSAERFSFISTGTTRTIQSAMAFAYGLFEGKGRLGTCKFQPIAVESSKIDNDPLLRFFDVCPKYSVKVLENKTALYEFEKFKHSSPMRDVKERLSRRLAVNSSALSYSDAIGMYLACSFEVALYGKTKNWCTLLEKEDLLVVEYLYDLKHFWKRGYGYEISYKIACTLLSDIYQLLANASNHLHDKHGVFRFAHGETLQPLYALLGLFKDSEKLRADNFHEELRVTQKYKTSKISPFGANIVFVLYECNSSDGNPEQFKLQAFVNEVPITLPGCDKESLCPLGNFLHYYQEDVHKCDLQQLCKVESPRDFQEENRHGEL